jgi:hypothetical protein
MDRRPSAGLCETCARCRKIPSPSGSLFFLCRLSETDPRYPRYPPLPVVRCEGYSRVAEDSGRPSGDAHGDPGESLSKR